MRARLAFSPRLCPWLQPTAAPLPVPALCTLQHLRDAASVDGKAARSLTKLRLFRSFYITVVSYIYFTRIVVYLLKNTVSYRRAALPRAACRAAADAQVLAGVLLAMLWSGRSRLPRCSAVRERCLHSSLHSRSAHMMCAGTRGCLTRRPRQRRSSSMCGSAPPSGPTKRTFTSSWTKRT